MNCPHCGKEIEAKKSKMLVPFGKQKGTPIEQLDVRGLQSLLKWLEDHFDPGSKYADRNQEQIDILKSELKIRAQDVLF